MIKIAILCLATITTQSRRLLQFVPAPPGVWTPPGGAPQIPGAPQVPFNPQFQQTQLPATSTAIGAYGQNCGPITSSFICLNTNTVLTDQGTGKVECNNAYSCCLCQTVTCGYEGKACDGIYANDFALYGVKQIAIAGEYNGQGALLACNSATSCAETYVWGSWVDTIMCKAAGACDSAVMDLTASRGVSCNERACQSATFNMLSNIDGDIYCAGRQSCVGTIMNIDGGVERIVCGARKACQNAVITLTNPKAEFLLSCGADYSCEGLTLNIIIPEPVGGCAAAGFSPTFTEWKGLSCAGDFSCKDLTVVVENNGCNPIMVEELTCQAGDACVNANFDFHAGTSPYEVYIANCLCGPSCQLATGIDKCYNNVRVAECLNPFSCTGPQTLMNVANDFILLCPQIDSCNGLNMAIEVSSYSQNIIRRFIGVSCLETRSCQDMVFGVNNYQYDSTGAQIPITMDLVTCAKKDSCKNAIFVTGPSLTITEFVCLPGACDNCRITSDLSLPGVPCPEMTTLPPTTPSPVLTTAAPTTPQPIIISDPIVPNPLTSAPITTSAATTAAATTAAPVTTVPVVPTDPTIPNIPIATIPRIPLQTLPRVTPAPVTTTAAPITTTAAPIITTAAAPLNPLPLPPLPPANVPPLPLTTTRAPPVPQSATTAAPGTTQPATTKRATTAAAPVTTVVLTPPVDNQQTGGAPSPAIPNPLVLTPQPSVPPASLPAPGSAVAAIVPPAV